MPLLTTKIPRRPLLRLLSTASGGTTAIESRDQKLNRIADDLLALTKAEREDYSTLFRHKLGLTQWVLAFGLNAAYATGPASEEKKEEKTAFDIKLEKFEAAAKIKVIKEVRAFTDLGLKEAKELVEKTPVVIKKGVLKEEAERIVAKLKEIGAAAILE
ncbi:uncharacterized protein A4U43_C03F17730 [Asparagus officinalis]|uniref:Large ribosomal subunit protein bL12 C-terminal domain-containing protein n=1 Tax=Asparagus officinalis TaxID=4686 RepID=A0A5P1FAX2_ASPOF|nr:uncharacterized protein A4U43_C03F17730 [Asparagus officinalis]